ncbi:MAG: cyclic nucleotide-binding domain-containing protein, partial [Brevundimonas sp.]|nr:cyclic nucleotide-binding domain-containing protein [Brevundimonas sp.]
MESIAFDLRQTRRTPLSPAHVEAIRAAGQTRTYKAGEFLARPGDRMDQFVWLEAGEVEVVDLTTGERRLPSTLGPGQFM